MMLSAPTKSLSETDLLRLFTTLEEMVSVYQKLLSLLQDEKRLIIEGDVDLLVRCAAEKEAVLAQLSNLHKNRIEITQSLHRSDPPLTLKALIPLCSPSHCERLRSAHARLEALTTSINEINQINGILVKRVLGQISGLLGLYRQMTSNEPIYQETGKIDMMQSGGRTIGKG